MRRLSLLSAVLALACSLAWNGMAVADAYPNKPIRLVVPAGAGTSADRYARLLAYRLSESIKQSVVVENKPGAAGTIGADAVAKAPPDGYILLFGVSAIFSTNPHVYRKIPFDVRRDFAAVEPIVKGYPYLFVPATRPPAHFSSSLSWRRRRKER